MNDHTVVVQIEFLRCDVPLNRLGPSEDASAASPISLKAALDVAAVFGPDDLRTELRPELLLVIKRDDEIGPDSLLEESLLLDFPAEARCGRPPRHC